VSEIRRLETEFLKFSYGREYDNILRCKNNLQYDNSSLNLANSVAHYVSRYH